MWESAFGKVMTMASQQAPLSLSVGLLSCFWTGELKIVLCSGWVADITIYGRFPVTYFETDAYITFLNEQNLPNLNLTVDDATRLKRIKPAQILKKQGRSILEMAGSVEKITHFLETFTQCSSPGRLEKSIK
jgi:hypothetical protein